MVRWSALLLVLLAAVACADTPADHHDGEHHDGEHHEDVGEADRDAAGTHHGDAGEADRDAAEHHHAAGAGEPTPAQRAAADQLVADTVAGLARFADLGAAKAEGYQAVTSESLPVVHYLHPGYLGNGDVLDPDHPESLVYARAGEHSVLLGAMFLMPSPGVPGPQIGGPLTVWHTHEDLCIDVAAQMVVGFVDAAGDCPAGAVNTETPEMLHVWVVDNPDGPFAHDMSAAALLRHLAS